MTLFTPYKTHSVLNVLVHNRNAFRLMKLTQKRCSCLQKSSSQKGILHIGPAGHFAPVPVFYWHIKLFRMVPVFHLMTMQQRLNCWRSNCVVVVTMSASYLHDEPYVRQLSDVLVVKSKVRWRNLIICKN